MGSNSTESQKNQNRITRNTLDTSRADIGGQYQNAIRGFTGDINKANTNSSTLRNSLMNTYGKAPANSYGVSGSNDARPQSGLPSFTDGSSAEPYTGGGGESNPEGGGELNSFLPQGMTTNSQGWFNLPNDGGPQYAAGGDFSKAKSGYSNFADTGGADQYAKAQAGADEFARSGGVNATALRNRATAQIPSFYDAYKNSAQRRSNVQGGYSPGFDAQQAELGRQAGREGFNASRQVEGDIADKEQAGREFGIGTQAGIAGNINSNKLTGLGGLTNIGGMEQSNNQFNAGAGNAYNARNLAAQLELTGMGQKGRMFSAGQMQDLYHQDRSDAQSGNSNLLSGLSGMSNNDLNNLQLRLAASQNKGIDWEKWARIGGQVASVAAFV